MTGPEKLRRLAQDIAGLIRQERLLKLNPTARTISPELGIWFIRAVRARDPSKALGLANGPGRPRQSAKEQQSRYNRQQARRAFFIKREQPKKTFAQIAADIGAPDGEWLRKEYNRYKQQFQTEVMAAELTARLGRPRRKK